MERIAVCFVCLGNICRSPTAAAVMRSILADSPLRDRVEVESAGTASWHVGEGPDPRTAAAARRRGLPMDHRAARFAGADFARFDLVLAMDHENLAELHALAPSSADRAKVHLLRAFDPSSPPDAVVPDPYYGGADGFEHVIDLCEAACRGVLDRLAAGLRTP